MKARWSSMVFMAGLVLALSGLAGTAIRPRAVQATTACPTPGDSYGCLVTGSTASKGWEVRNSKSGNQVFGIQGVVNQTSGTSYATAGTNDSTGGYGVFGYATASSGSTVGTEGYAASTSGTGVRGDAIATGGTNYGVYGTTASSSGYGVYGIAAATSGINFGVVGKSNSSSGYGVYGINNNDSGFGILGQSISSLNGVGVRGETSGIGWGVQGSGYIGVEGGSPKVGGTGVYAAAGADTGTNYGLYSTVDSPTAYAGYFNGRVHVNGTLSKLAGSFKIDHPLDPANKYLSHSFVEAPDMMNIYNGNVTLDAKGKAIVELPKWFEALNQEFRYQLTALGAPGPNLYVAEEIKGNRFTIAGGTPGSKVSWQVTGIRHDPYANAHRIQVEEDKPAEERGTYLYPQGYGQPATKGRDYQQQQMNTAP